MRRTDLKITRHDDGFFLSYRKHFLEEHNSITEHQSINSIKIYNSFIFQFFRINSSDVIYLLLKSDIFKLLKSLLKKYF